MAQSSLGRSRRFVVQGHRSKCRSPGQARSIQGFCCHYSVRRGLCSRHISVLWLYILVRMSTCYMRSHSECRLTFAVRFLLAAFYSTDPLNESASLITNPAFSTLARRNRDTRQQHRSTEPGCRRLSPGFQAHASKGDMWRHVLASYTTSSGLWSISSLMPRSSLGSCELLVLQVDARSGASTRPFNQHSRCCAEHGEVLVYMIDGVR